MGSVQLALQAADSLVDETRARLRRHLAGQHALGGGDGGVDGDRADVGDGLGFGTGDLLLGELEAAIERFDQRLARLDCQRIGFASGLFDDGPRFLLGCLTLLMLVGEQCLRFLAQAACFVELLPDAVGTVVERLSDEVGHLVVEKEADEAEERDRDPEFGFGHHGAGAAGEHGQHRIIFPSRL